MPTFHEEDLQAYLMTCPPGAWTDTVYGCVPLALAAAAIELHGGREVPR